MEELVYALTSNTHLVSDLLTAQPATELQGQHFLVTVAEFLQRHINIRDHRNDVVALTGQ